MSATLQARALITELIKAGVSDLVIAPGSRNGPISLAALSAPQLNVTVRIDERSAAFTALGLAKITGRKVAVLVTSGTAGAHLLPALIEAAESDIELIAITADRPTELVNTGANQTIEQLQLFASATNSVIDLLANWPAEMWQNEVRIALSRPGIIHLNPRFSEPLIPDSDWKPNLIESEISKIEPTKLDAASHLNGKLGVVISSGDQVKHAGQIAQKLNWPLIAEPASTLSPNLVANGSLTAAKFQEKIEVVVTVGRVGLARTINNLINTKPRVAVKVPTRLSRVNAIALSQGEIELTNLLATGHQWLHSWHEQAGINSEMITEKLNSSPLSGLDVANAMFQNLKSSNHLHAAASLSLRDLDYLMQPNSIGQLTANRGVNGIDGIVASAIGAAVAWQRAGNGQSYCLLGDVALLHDASSLTIPATETMPDLRLVVVDNNGGGVFSTIEQRGVAGFERVFGTPHSANISAILQGFGIPVTEVKQKSDLVHIFSNMAGLSAVVISGIDREVEADLRKTLLRLTR